MNDKLKGKVFITGEIIAETGLHIGGSKSSLNIGEIDANVIKDSQGVPYIPGSSLKGKLRSLLAKVEGSKAVENDPKYIKEIFGSTDDNFGPTRLITRDCRLKNKDELLRWETEMNYTESKWENTIDRKTGTTIQGGLRQIERVPKGAKFDFELIYDVYSETNLKPPIKWDIASYEKGLEEIKNKTIDNSPNKEWFNIRTLLKALSLLEDDYLGGNGTRGYGKVRINDLKIIYKPIRAYWDNTSTLDLNILNIFDFKEKKEKNASH
ncbi:type III-A CRISPR-associated RAMP protein Csm3 [Thermophagus sp. OGC60D27]|uniref:type III-A CRISPR-associated RAMP protein Csm3 n=1 Tax=Thermophagus sp. OGC60D27 TaxID=3458415 RepID=UPI00403841F9